MRQRVGQQGGVGGGEQECRNFAKDLTRVKKKVAQNSLGVALFLNVLPNIVYKEDRYLAIFFDMTNFSPDSK